MIGTPPPNTRRADSAGRNAPANAVALAMIPKVQPTEPSIRDNASETSMTVSGSASQPPSSCAHIKRNSLVWRAALIIGSASRARYSDLLGGFGTTGGVGL